MKGLEMVKCESLRMNMYRITQTGKSMNFPVTAVAVAHQPPTSSAKNPSWLNCKRLLTH